MRQGKTVVNKVTIGRLLSSTACFCENCGVVSVKVLVVHKLLFVSDLCKNVVPLADMKF